MFDAIFLLVIIVAMFVAMDLYGGIGFIAVTAISIFVKIIASFFKKSGQQAMHSHIDSDLKTEESDAKSVEPDDKSKESEAKSEDFYKEQIQLEKKKQTKIIVLAIIAIAWIAFFKAQKEDYPRKNNGPKLQTKLETILKGHISHAEKRNKSAEQRFSQNWRATIKQVSIRCSKSIVLASAKASEMKNCCYLVYCLAWDKCKNTNSAEEHIIKTISPIIKPALEESTEKLNSCLESYNNSMRKSSAILAKDLASMLPNSEDINLKLDIGNLSDGEFKKALSNLGYNAAGNMVGVAFDVYGILTASFFKKFCNRLSLVGMRLFGKQITKLAGSATIAAADGPIPIGDVLAVCGLIWTAYDINSAKQEFGASVKKELVKIVGNHLDRLNKRAEDKRKIIHDSYINLQNSIENSTRLKLVQGN
jgi:hypothetical protein